MAATRIVLDPEDQPKAEEILQQTGIKTFSQLFAIFIHNYGDVLVSSLKGHQGLVRQPVPVSQRKTPGGSAGQANKTFTPMSF